MEFVRLVDEINPTFFLMENVPGILSMKTKDKNFVKDIIISEFEKLGYIVQVNKLNSADFGVPQLRNRVFFIGTKMPKNQNIEFDFNPTLIPSMRLTIENALSDLPEKGLDGDVHSEYKKNYSNDYQKWARFSSKGIINHVQMRHSDRLIERFKNIKQGESLADVGNEHMQRKRGDAGEISGKVYSQNNMRPYWKKPSPTIAASFQSNFIHPLFNRNYTAREAARIQSFPDYYEFKGKRTTMSWEKNLSQYQQIGNAVPPLLAKSIALVLYKTLFI
jgi:DNA (cytosine-5)-methyltransferase 1